MCRPAQEEEGERSVGLLEHLRGRLQAAQEQVEENEGQLAAESAEREALERRLAEAVEAADTLRYRSVFPFLVCFH